MHKSINNIQLIRSYLLKHSIEALIIPTSDPHLSEYIHPHWEMRAWASGFTGSAGTLLVTTKVAKLWTDSRYFLQAAEELQGSEIELMKSGLKDTPQMGEFLLHALNQNDSIALDKELFSAKAYEDLANTLKEKNIHIKDCHQEISEIWPTRPPLPTTPIEVYPLRYAGQSCAEKIKRIRQELKKKETEGCIISALDEIAWTLNCRGKDIHYNPVSICYLIIEIDLCILFIDKQKLTDAVEKHLEANHIQVMDYHEIYNYLSTRTPYSFALDPDKTNAKLYYIASTKHNISNGSSPIAIFKSIRNDCEIQGLHNVMVKDGVALVKFLIWLEKAIPEMKETELSVQEKLLQFREQQPLFQDVSFETICGYKEHAAIVHYTANSQTNVLIHPRGYILIDSGGQYLDGTTDITRTIALGELTDEEKRDYTLVLKGHIALASSIFPEGTRGSQLDVLARMPLWKEKKNYLHGTGHGVGHYLNVHEGPQSIRMNENPIAILPGMLTSNEPGIYIEGKHGIRIENLCLAREESEGMFGNYLSFETVTLCPICTKGIISSLLTTDEKNWLNAYHNKVFALLSPKLNPEEKEWLKKATQAII